MSQATTNTAVTPTNTKLAEALRRLVNTFPIPVDGVEQADRASLRLALFTAREALASHDAEQADRASLRLALFTAREALASHDAEQAQEPVLQDIEQYRMQMAGISTAALGYWKEGDSIHPDYDTVALRDVAKLYAKYDRLFKIVSAYAEQA